MDDYGPSPEQAAREQQNIEAEAAWHAAKVAPRRTVSPTSSHRAGPSAAQLKAYRSLPAGTREDLKSLIVDEHPVVRDGGTHQFWDWTNADVADLLTELTGETEFVIACRPGGSWCRLTRIGDLVHREPVDATHGGESNVDVRRPITHRHGGPSDRYNAQGPALDLPGRAPGSMPVCTASSTRPDANAFDPYVISGLREVYRGSLISRRSTNQLQQINAERQRGLSKMSGPALLLLVLIVIVLVVVAYSAIS